MLLFAFFILCAIIQKRGQNMNENVEKFLKSCDELINCKFLVAEYKLQKLLQELANTQEVCSLIGECLEQFNRDREFAKSFVQDGNGEYMFVLPEEEYKVLSLVFCTLVDIDSKKIDLTDFVKRFFGNADNPYKAFVEAMVVPFRNLIAEAFSYSQQPEQEEIPQEETLTSEIQEQEINEHDDLFEKAQKIAVQISSQLEYARNEFANNMAMQVCRAIVKTTAMKDIDVSRSLVFALQGCKAKQVKFLVKELCELFE